ncbi:unnamed protein product [Urochloa humidicola]
MTRVRHGAHKGSVEDDIQCTSGFENGMLLLNGEEVLYNSPSSLPDEGGRRLAIVRMHNWSIYRKANIPCSDSQSSSSSLSNGN